MDESGKYLFEPPDLSLDKKVLNDLFKETLTEFLSKDFQAIQLGSFKRAISSCTLRKNRIEKFYLNKLLSLFKERAD